MKKILQYIIILLISLVLLSCEKVLEFDSDDLEPKIVLSSFVQADSLIEVSVSLTKSIPGTEKPFVWINNAQVVLFVDGVETEKLKPYKIEKNEDDYYWYDEYNNAADSIYRTVTTRASEGKTYRIEVTHPTYGKASGETTIPRAINITSLISQTNTSTNDYGGKSIEYIVKTKFNDKQNEENYYRLSFKRTYGTIQDKSNYIAQPIQTDTIYVYTRENSGTINSSDPILTNNNDPNDILFSSPNNNYNIFTDELIEGKEYEIAFTAMTDYFYENTDQRQNLVEKPGEFLSVEVKLSTITREAYLYLKSMYAQQWYNDQFFAEPVPVFSNIENGVGIVAGYTSSTMTLTEGNYPLDSITYIPMEYDYYY